jgi:hypothetical protein
MMRSGPELPGLMRLVTLRNNVAFLIYLSIDEEGHKERADIDTEVNLRWATLSGRLVRLTG